MCVCVRVCGNSHVCVGIPTGTGFSVPNLSKPVKGRAALPPLRSVSGPCSAYVCTSAHYGLFRSRDGFSDTLMALVNCEILVSAPKKIGGFRLVCPVWGLPQVHVG